jgi:GNAT superfamily N-acetyltransferase
MADIKVSLAVPSDLDRLMVLAQEFSDEAPETHKMELDVATNYMAAHLENPNGVVITLVVDNVIQGFLVGLCSSTLLSSKVLATELAWYVNKKHRGSGLVLLEVFEQWAEHMGASAVVMADLQDVASLARLYEKRGYKKREVSYVKEI